MAKRKKATRSEWSKDELRMLKKLFRNTSTKEVAEALGRSATSVQAKASALGLKKTKKYLKSVGLSK